MTPLINITITMYNKTMSTKSRSINDTSAMEITDKSSKLKEKRFTQLSTAKQDNSTMSKFTHQIHRSTHHEDLFQTLFYKLSLNHKPPPTSHHQHKKKVCNEVDLVI